MKESISQICMSCLHVLPKNRTLVLFPSKTGFLPSHPVRYSVYKSCQLPISFNHHHTTATKQLEQLNHPQSKHHFCQRPINHNQNQNQSTSTQNPTKMSQSPYSGNSTPSGNSSSPSSPYSSGSSTPASSPDSVIWITSHPNSPFSPRTPCTPPPTTPEILAMLMHQQAGYWPNSYEGGN